MVYFISYLFYTKHTYIVAESAVVEPLEVGSEVEEDNSSTTPLPDLEAPLPPILEEEPKKRPEITGHVSIDSMSLSQLRARPDLACRLETAKAYKQRITALGLEDARAKTENLLDQRKAYVEAKRQRRREQGTFVPSSGIMAESCVIIDAEADSGDLTVGGSLENKEVHENVIHYTGETSDKITVGKPLHHLPDGGQTMHSLENFFKRPFTIYDDTMTLGQDHLINLPVWDLWSRNPAVRNKLTNYAYFRGNLHVKVSLSSTPYHYGRLLTSYQPYPAFNDTLKMYDTLLVGSIPNPNDVLPLYNTYLTQAHGARVMDVKENKPMEIEIPFISYKQKFRLFNDDGLLITNATPFYDFAEAGELRLSTLTHFMSATDDAQSPVSISVIVWATDVELGTITGTNMNITAQSELVIEAESEEEKPMYSGEGSFGSRLMKSLEKGVSGGHDEYTEPGPITTVATAVGKAGEALADIPIIGNFAKATSTIAKSVGKVASWFGWSKPVVLDKPVFVKNQPFVNGANLEGHETALRITCDPKQELSVDPSLGGMTGDELTIKNLASKETYIGAFAWTNNDLAMSDVLWKSGVSPFLGQRLTTGITTNGGRPNLCQDSAMAFAARPFKFWRGTIKYRFEVVCSKFHRGKLLFRYEPNSSQYGLIASADAQLNQQNTTILDIQDGQTITFECDWAQTRAWATSPTNAREELSLGAHQYGNDTPFTNTAYSFDPTFHEDNSFNGIIECRVLNELVQPTASSSVIVNVYAWCEDLQVAMPTYVNLPTTRTIDAQSAIVQPEKDTTAALVKTNASLDNLHLEHFGERILSFRSLLKRYQTTIGASHTADVVGPGYWSFREFNIPRGLSPKVSSITADFSPAAGEVPQNLFIYMRHAFMGMRGSMRHRLTFIGDSIPHALCYTKVSTTEAEAPSLTSNGLQYIQALDLNSIITNRYTAFINSITGTVDFHVHTNGGIEFEVPYYSPNLFEFAFEENSGVGVGLDTDFGFDPKYPQKWVANLATNWTALDDKMMALDSVSIGEDFQFFRFQGAPPHAAK